MTSLPTLLTATEVAEEFRLDPGTVRRWAREARIQVIRLPSGLLRFRREDVEAILAGQPARTEAGAQAS
jgi:excisionase family DNA binding protein